MGDLNTSASPTIALALALGWHDLGPATPTTYAGSRIDYIIGCAATRAAFVESDTADVKVPVHLAVVARFSWERAQQQYRKTVKPRAYLKDRDERVRCQARGDLADTLWGSLCEREPAWRHALQQGSDAAYRILMTDFEEWLSIVTGKEGRTYDGRGVTHGDITVWMLGKAKPGGLQSAELKLAKAKHRLEELRVQQLQLGYVTWTMKQLWRKALPQIRHAIPVAGATFTDTIPPPGVVGHLVGQLQQLQENARRADMKLRRDSFAKIVDEEQRGLFKWLKTDQMPVEGIAIERADGTMTANIDEAHRLVSSRHPQLPGAAPGGSGGAQPHS